MRHLEPIDILLVEDSPTDARLLQFWLGASPLVNRIHVVALGREALQLLGHPQAIQESPVRPQLVISDIHLPDMSGWEVLRRLRRQPRWARLPVVVLSGSLRPEADAGHGSQANLCLPKPRAGSEFSQLVESIEDFWRDWTRRSTTPPKA